MSDDEIEPSTQVTIERAREAMGEKVVYHAPHVPRTHPGEEGVIDAVGGHLVHVRYGSDTGTKGTRPDDLTFVTPR